MEKDKKELSECSKLNVDECRHNIPLILKSVSLVTRRIRFPGRERILRTLFPPAAFRFKYKEKIVNYDRDLRITCDLGSYIEWSIFFKGYYAPDLSLALKRLAKPGMAIIDVGANIGAYSLLFAKNVGVEGEVVSIEPNPETFTRLRSNVLLNEFDDRTKVIQVALSNKSGQGTLFVPKSEHPHRGIASLQKYTELNTERVTVKVETLDDFLSKLGISRVNFLKIDTDGSDAFILEGAKSILQNFHPIIVFEANYSAHPESEATILEIRNMLIRLGYEFFSVGLFGRLIPLQKSQKLPDTNIVCISGFRQ